MRVKKTYFYPGNWSDVVDILIECVTPRMALRGAMQKLYWEIKFLERVDASQEIINKHKERLRIMRLLDRRYAQGDTTTTIRKRASRQDV